ncbi:MAG TPA: hypothetical protein VFL42_12140 [Terriglobales bacterium]|nr:hypothetical protein [Terriglobales bacterium]
MKVIYSLFVSAMLLALAGCASSGSTDCSPTALNVTPASASVDHTALAPANSEIFSASFLPSSKPGCVSVAITPALANSNWTVSDPSVHLSSTPTTQITATCTAALASPATITATAASGQPLSGQATLACK